MTVVYQTISGYHLRAAGSAALAAGLPFCGIAGLAAVMTIRRRKQPAARVMNSDIGGLVLLLVLSGFWVVAVLFVWGL